MYSLEARIAEINHNVKSQVISANNSRSALGRQSDTLRSISNNINSLAVGSEVHRYQVQCATDRHTGMLGGIDQQLRTHMEYSQSTLQAVQNLETNMSSAARMSSVQLATIITMLESIVPSLPGSPQPTQMTTGLIDCPGNNISVIGSQISGCFERLAQLARMKEATTTIRSKDAQSIIDDLETIVNIVYNNLEIAKPKTRQRENKKVDIHDFKRIKGSLMLTDSVMLKKNAPIFNLPAGGQYSRPTRYDSFQAGEWTLEMRSQHGRLTEGTYLDPDECITDTHAATITITSNKRVSRIIASFHHRQWRYGCNSLKPTLRFSAVIPTDSLAFVFARRGNLDGIRRLLNTGKASVNDSNLAGKTMLHVYPLRPFACDGKQPNVCKFLLSHGADPDAVGKGNTGTIFSSPLLFTPENDYDFDATPQSARECMIHLLDAGADPLLAVDGYSSLVIYALNVMDSVFPSQYIIWPLLMIVKGLLQLALDHSIIDLNAALDEWSFSPFLHSATLVGRSPYEKRLTRLIRFLLERGGNPNARTTCGKTWFHIAFENVYNATDLKGEILRDIFRLMLEMGFDIQAVDSHGTTVTQSAYRSHCGRLWEECLSASGLDAAKL
ncbi:ankyrin repeat-containing domain protein [Trichophaea hybrida]|nr:ankyrin repeat-containing domain protein [Trichophaea hybrida]